MLFDEAKRSEQFNLLKSRGGEADKLSMSKKIGIYQVDGKMPNLALMQIARYHENQGDEIENYQGLLFAPMYDKIYMSKIFDFSPMPQVPENAVIGGTGINWTNQLPCEMKDLPPSYTLYPDCDYHLGFSMKGCRFRCKFCVVPQKEGRPSHNSTIDDLLINPKGENRLMLMDNDFFGSPNWKENLERIIELDLKVCFVQGLNIRIITKEQAELLAKCRYYNSKFKKRYLTFAWDKYRDEKIVMKGIKICNDAGIPTEHMQFFVLIGFDTTPEQDYERVMKLKELGAKPYVMPYNKEDKYQKAFTRWVNYRPIFETVKWEDYKYNNFKTTI